MVSNSAMERFMIKQVEPHGMWNHTETHGMWNHDDIVSSWNEKRPTKKQKI